MNKVEPSFSVELWIEKPDAAEALMNSDSENAADYTAAGMILFGGVAMAWVTNFLIKRSAGPFGGVIDLVMKTFKKEDDTKK